MSKLTCGRTALQGRKQARRSQQDVESIDWGSSGIGVDRLIDRVGMWLMARRASMKESTRLTFALTYAMIDFPLFFVNRLLAPNIARCMYTPSVFSSRPSFGLVFTHTKHLVAPSV